MALKKTVRRRAARYALEALVRFPQTVSEPLIKAVLQKVWRRETASIRPMVEAVKRFSENTNKNCQERFLENLVLRGLIDNQKIRDEVRRQGLPPLHTILLSPTMRCNLDCRGCYSKNYQKKDDLPFEAVDRVLKEGKKKERRWALHFSPLWGENLS